MKLPPTPPTEIRLTSTGPIACYDGIWYSVNGTQYEVAEIRFAIPAWDLEKFGVKNDAKG